MAAALLPALLAAACSAPGDTARPQRGPVVLITLGALRADAVEALAAHPAGDLTPHLDALVREADCAARAVAPSGLGLLSLATYLTGLSPWQHGTFRAGEPTLAPELRTLAEAFAERGYRGTAYVEGPWPRGDAGWAQGFSDFRPLRAARRAAGHLASLSGRQLVWVHLADPAPPWRRRAALVDRLPPPVPRPGTLERRLPSIAVERLQDPAAALPAARRRELASLYRLAVARTDDRLGVLLDALRSSGSWDDTLLVVVATQGEAVGGLDAGGVARGLERGMIEVPLVVKLSAALRRAGATCAGGSGEPPAAARVWATLVEAVGAEVPPAAAPSLLGRAAPGVLSELYLTNGDNRFSWVAGDRQLLWRAPFAPPEPGYFAARRAAYAAAGAPLPPATAAVFERLSAAFAATPPLSGDGAVVELVAWTADGGTRRIRPPTPRAALPGGSPAAAMAGALERRWRAFEPCERPPGADRRERAAARHAAADG